MLPPPTPARAQRSRPPPIDQGPCLPPRGTAGGAQANPRGGDRNEGFLGLVPARLMHKNDELKLGLIAVLWPVAMLADWIQSLFCLVPYLILTPCWCRPQRWRDFLRPCAHAHRNARWLASLSVLLHALSYPLMLMLTATLARNNKCALFFANTKLILIFKKA